MKKLLLMLGISVMVMGLAVGCGEKKKAEEAAPAETAAPATEAAPAEEAAPAAE